MIRLSSLVFICAMLFALPGIADTINVPVDQPTIQAGIDAAEEGDTVLVAEGVYTGEGNRNLAISDANIILESAGGAAVTVIDCEEQNLAIRITAPLDNVEVRGFTIRNGVDANGGGILVLGAVATIADCILTDCDATNSGGGINLNYAGSGTLVTDCTISGCNAAVRGGGIYIDNSEALITGCTLFENYSGVQGGGGIFCNACTPTISDCTVVDNSVFAGVAGIHTNGSAVTVNNTVIAFNRGGSATDACCGTFTHCIAFGNSEGDDLHNGAENLEVDPLFCDPDNSDYTVCADSPCLPGSADNPWGEQVGAQQSGCGDCGQPVTATSWGAVKSLFR